MATKSSSAIQYRNALWQNVDLEYIILPSRIKENIILQSQQDISYYVITFYTENLSARLLENREIQFYNNIGEVICTMTSPYMYDSAGELSENIAVEMVSKGDGCYFIKMTPDVQWLCNEERAYPVVIDPQVSVDTTQTNIVDNYVLKGAGNQNRNLDRLEVRMITMFRRCCIFRKQDMRQFSVPKSIMSMMLLMCGLLHTIFRSPIKKENTMKKQAFAVLLCCVLFVLSGSTKADRYQRISFESESLGEQLSYIKEDTVIVNKTNETFTSQIPIYKIEKRRIANQEYQQMRDNLELEDTQYYDFKLSGNYLHINLVSRVDFSRGYFEMTEEEGEKLAWEVFNKIPFMEGEYECAGIKDSYRVYDGKDYHIARAGYVFCRVLDGARVVGDESCTLYFDGSGLVAIYIRLYEYKKIGTMDLVPLEDAEARLKTPDDFHTGIAGLPSTIKLETLQVDQVKLRLINQHADGCTILQPIYYFTGTALFSDETQSGFSSKIIAIPESYTYEKEET